MNQRSPTLNPSKPLPSFTPVQTGLLQRKCACGNSSGLTGKCSECQKKKLSLQRRAVNNQAESSEVPPIVHEVLRSPGQPLDLGIRTFMESRFGHDFSQVRVHTDGKAAKSAQSVNALAYTVGQNVVFNSGQYAPNATQGKRLLVHELAHVVQQSQMPEIDSRTLTLDQPSNRYESEAEQAALSVDMSAQISPTKSSEQIVNSCVTPASARTLQRQLVTPLASGGGYQGLLERDRQATTTTLSSGSEQTASSGREQTASSGSTTLATITPQIDVRSKGAASVGIVGFQHLFIVETDTSGDQWFYRGGASNRCPGTRWPFYGIKTDSGRYLPGTIDWSPGAPSVTVATGSATSGKAACFSSELTRIHGSCTPYNPLGPNSNTVVKTLLVNCSLPTRSPVSSWRTPGFGHPPI